MSNVDYFHLLSGLNDEARAILEKGFNPLFYNVFNPEIKNQLLQKIQDGKKILTDKLFFKLLATTAAYLGTVAFQNRIIEWQEVCLFPENYSKKEQEIARANLLKIGRVLARSGPGRGSPDRLDNSAIYNTYTNKISMLEQFFAERREKPSSQALIKMHPEWKKAFMDEKGVHHHRSIPEMAIKLTLFHYANTQPSNRLSIRHMRKIIKDYSR